MRLKWLYVPVLLLVCWRPSMATGEPNQPAALSLYQPRANTLKVQDRQVKDIGHDYRVGQSGAYDTFDHLEAIVDT